MSKQLRQLRYFSCFTGLGSGEVAFLNVFPKAICVGYSEIEPAAIKVYESHFPTHRNYGDISKIKGQDLPQFDVIIGGSPCQGLSSMNVNKLEMKDKRSKLLMHYFRLLDECKPQFFILENVASMTTKIRDQISKKLKVEPVLINSNCFTPQTRRRYYWANFPIQPVETDIMCEYLTDILQRNRTDLKPTVMCIKKVPIDKVLPKTKHPYALVHMTDHHYKPRTDNKTGPVLTTTSTCSVVWDTKMFRQLTAEEMEMLQGLPPGWTDNVGLSNTERVKCVGNAFTVPVIMYILYNLKEYIKNYKSPSRRDSGVYV